MVTQLGGAGIVLAVDHLESEREALDPDRARFGQSVAAADLALPDSPRYLGRAVALSRNHRGSSPMEPSAKAEPG